MNFSANELLGLLISAIDVRHGNSPRIRKRITPGMRKFEKGEWSKIDIGKSPINLPEGEIIKKAPPPVALSPRNESKNTSMFRALIYLNKYWNIGLIK